MLRNIQNKNIVDVIIVNIRRDYKDEVLFIKYRITKGNQYKDVIIPMVIIPRYIVWIYLRLIWFLKQPIVSYKLIIKM